MSEWSDQPRFELSWATVRYNPVDGRVTFWIGAEGEAGRDGTITLRGWTRENAGLTHCHFELDTKLAPGTMVIEPRERDVGPFEEAA